MAKLQDVLAYILQRYPHKGELSNARVTKMVYLSDWKHVLENGHQISPIRWYFDNYGPFVWDVKHAAEANPFLFELKQTSNPFGSTKVLLACADEDYAPALSASEQAAVDHVIRTTQPLTYADFIGLVYSTYPIVSSERYSWLDLEKAAQEYKAREPRPRAVAG